jgi:pimeloyl-ACP methyl ester carboxylesterase
VADMVTLLARLDAQELHWVGTSMGGLIGMGVAQLAGSPLRKLVLNDVGPTIEYASLQRIGQYLGAPLRWPTVEAANAALWAISATFGPHTPEQQLALTRPQLRRVTDEGPGERWKSHYDPAIAVPFNAITPELAAAGQAALWAGYDRIGCPTLLLRGGESDLLSPATAQAMTQRGPKATLVAFAGVGHAPTLVQPDQRAAVRSFLLGA